ncbi:hypothetical protein [Noviherbaspirillum soli]|uniref:hypothetical protein n=1 Tax=Noviherbaspirillum soli TaxID=1064518 RepID=UPI00188A78E6|nr:hypothetical protein [Noviherbaspirillum soli]
MGYKEAKRMVLKALQEGNYIHDERDDIDVKNKFAMGEVTQAQVIDWIKRSNGINHTSSPLHGDNSVTVHIIKSCGWYIKFYILDPQATFISVHQ